MSHARPCFLTLAFTASLLLWVSIAVTPATAAQVTFAFKGTVTSVVDSLGTPSIGISPPLTGFYTFESSAVVGAPFVFSLALTDLTLSLGTLDVNGSGVGGGIFVGNNLFSLGESYSAISGVIGGTNPSDPFIFVIDLQGGSGGFINNFNSMPTTPPDLSSFAIKDFRFLFNSGAIAKGTLDSLTQVPLPPAVILFGAGLLALAGLGAGGWWQRESALPPPVSVFPGSGAA